MKKSSVFFILLMMSFTLWAQVELDESIIPKVNDSYVTFIDDVPEINLGKQGEDQDWDFSELRSGLIYESRLLPPDPVLIFNNIDYDFFVNEDDGVLRMFKQIGQQLFEVAIQKPHPLNSDYIVFARYENPKLTTYSPLKYRSEKTDRSLIYYYMPGKQIPALIQSKLPVTADSLRLKVSEVRDFRVDAAGTLSLSYGRYEVLRQEISTRTITNLEIFSAGRWSKINNNILDPNGELLGNNTSKEYIYYSDEEVQPLVTISLDSDGNITKAEIKAPEEKENFISADTDLQQLIVSPNPTYGDIKLEMMNLEPGTYQFEIFNIIGKKLWGEEVEVNRKLISAKYNFGFLGKGTYLWAITDSKGVRITTKRLVIVTP